MFTEDLSVFFDTDGFAETATYKVGGAGAGTPVTVLFGRKPPQPGPLGLGVRLSGYSAQLRKSEVSAPAEGDTLTIGGVVYRVRTFDPDVTGQIWTLQLDES